MLQGRWGQVEMRRCGPQHAAQPWERRLRLATLCHDLPPCRPATLLTSSDRLRLRLQLHATSCMPLAGRIFNNATCNSTSDIALRRIGAYSVSTGRLGSGGIEVRWS